MSTKDFIRAVKRSCCNFLVWTWSRYSRYVSVCILLLWDLAEVKQLTETLRSEAELFWCQIMRNAKILSSSISQHAAPGEVTGFSCYYLALAWDEPVVIWCNFTVLWSGRGEGGLRMMPFHCPDCTTVSILLPSCVCFWQAHILKGIESFWF